MSWVRTYWSGTCLSRTSWLWIADNMTTVTLSPTSTSPEHEISESSLLGRSRLAHSSDNYYQCWHRLVCTSLLHPRRSQLTVNVSALILIHAQCNNTYKVHVAYISMVETLREIRWPQVARGSPCTFSHRARLIRTAVRRKDRSLSDDGGATLQGSAKGPEHFTSLSHVQRTVVLKLFLRLWAWYPMPLAWFRCIIRYIYLSWTLITLLHDTYFFVS